MEKRQSRISIIKLILSIPDDMDTIFDKLNKLDAYHSAKGHVEVGALLSDNHDLEESLRKLSDKHELIKRELEELFGSTNPSKEHEGMFREVFGAFDKEYQTCMSAIYMIDFEESEKRRDSILISRTYAPEHIEQSRKIFRMVSEQIALLFPIDEQMSAQEPVGQTLYFGDNAIYVEKQLVEKAINIGNGNTISAPIVVAETIQNSFTALEGHHIDSEAKLLIQTLLGQITEVAKVTPDQEASELADNAEALAKEVARSKPRREWYELSIKGLVEAAKALGEIGKPIIETTEKLLPVLATLWP